MFNCWGETFRERASGSLKRWDKPQAGGSVVDFKLISVESERRRCFNHDFKAQRKLCKLSDTTMQIYLLLNLSV